MNAKNLLLTVPLTLVWLTSGCRTAPIRPEHPSSISDETRNNSYSLLCQLLDEEKDVSKLRFIKHEDLDLKNLINRVAKASRLGSERLHEFAKQDPSLMLKDSDLPRGEVQTRDAIGKTKEHELLHTSGDTFEKTLILTQIEALNYAAHLAKVAAANDFQSTRVEYLKQLSQEMTTLHDEVESRLTVTLQPVKE